MPSGKAADTSAGNGCVAGKTGPGSTGASGSEMTTGLEQADTIVTSDRAANALCVIENIGLTFIKFTRCIGQPHPGPLSFQSGQVLDEMGSNNNRRVAAQKRLRRYPEAIAQPSVGQSHQSGQTPEGEANAGKLPTSQGWL